MPRIWTHKITVRYRLNEWNVAENTILRNVKKPKKVVCKCANCGEEHTTNWKRCATYKEKLASLQKSKTTITQRIEQKTRTPIENVTPKLFAKAASGKHTTFNQSNRTGWIQWTTIQDIWNLFRNMQQMFADTEHRLDTLENGEKGKRTNLNIPSIKRRNNRLIASNHYLERKRSSTTQ